ncbi:hypothetical protein WDW89_24600 [Deltaproteobacteria bacterium TL4]
MEERLFLYIDILGFSDLIINKKDVAPLFQIINNAQIHRDSNFVTIVFSDTIVAYNRHSNLNKSAKTIEVMYLIELTQELFSKLIGTNIFFRAIITEGEFFHNQLENLAAYYGTALVEAYRAEKKLSGTGLFLDRKLRDLNSVFRFKEFSDKFDYIFLTHMCSGITSWLKRNVDENDRSDYSEFPIHPELLTSASLEFEIYPELVHFKEVYQNMNTHPEPKVREKYLTTWNMYSHIQD